MGKAQDAGGSVVGAVSSPGLCYGDHAAQGSDPERVFLADSMASFAGDSPMRQPLQRLQRPHWSTASDPKSALNAPFYRVSSFWACGSCPLKIIQRC